LRVLGGICSEGVFELFLTLLCHFSLVCRFSYLLLALRLFLLLDDFLQLFVDFWFSSCASWGLEFENQILWFFVDNELIKWEIEKPSG
jgi:hypothetical protein